MADSLGMATRLKMSSHPASAAPDEQVQDKEPGSASSAGPSGSPAALTQGPVLHVTQVHLTTPAHVQCCPRLLPIAITSRHSIHKAAVWHSCNPFKDFKGSLWLED